MAEEVIARILSISKSTEPLVEINSLSSFEAHDREQDLVSDRPGRGSNGSGEGRHAMDEKTTHKEHNALSFAKQLSDYWKKISNRKLIRS